MVTSLTTFQFRVSPELFHNKHHESSWRRKAPQCYFFICKKQEGTQMLGAKSNSLHQVPFWGLSNRESTAKRQPSPVAIENIRNNLWSNCFQHMTTSLRRHWPLAWRLLKSVEVNSEHSQISLRRKIKNESLLVKELIVSIISMSTRDKIQTS